MKRNEYTLLKRQIPDVNLHSLTGQYWFDFTNSWVPWNSGSGMIPETGSLVRDVKWYSDITYDKDVVLFHSGNTYSSLIESNLNNIPSTSRSCWEFEEQRAINNTKGKYYKWNGNTWDLYIGPLGYDHVIPIVLESNADEMGVMSSFDGNVEQVEQLVNFTYNQSGSVVTVYNTVNPDKLRKIVEQTYTIKWGDGTSGSLSVNNGILYSNFPTASHTYSSTGSYTLNLFLDSPWSKEKINKNITVPNTGSIVTNILGTFSGFTIPFTQITGSLDYLNNSKFSGFTGSSVLKYMSIGGSKIGELKKYGETTVSSSMYVT
jgi:hypothetical protein